MGGPLCVYLGDLYTKDELVEMVGELRRQKAVLQNRIVEIKSEVIKFQNDLFVGMMDKDDCFGALEELLEMLDEKVKTLAELQE